jgi:hypothetical protein
MLLLTVEVNPKSEVNSDSAQDSYEESKFGDAINKLSV